jgi:hypothetical protein
VHVVVWDGGRANECLRSVSKRTTKLFRTTPAAAPDRRLHKTHARPQNGGCAGAHCLVCQRARPKEGGGRPCLMMMLEQGERQNQHPPLRNQTLTQSPAQGRGRRDKPGRVGVAVVVLSARPHTRRGRQAPKTGWWWVHSHGSTKNSGCGRMIVVPS